MPRLDPAEISIFNSLFTSVAEEMGVTLGRTAHSPNIKERKDYSCAVFDSGGRLVAQAAHIPVHLGAMPTAVKAALPLAPFSPGDLVILNDPYLGGTHLPDITMVSPVFRRKQLIAFVASRAHHADVGGSTPGSMPLARELLEEGLIVPPIKLYEKGRLNQAASELMLRNVRTPEQRRGDLDSQAAANLVGSARLEEMVERYGEARIRAQMKHTLDYGERMTRASLAALPDGDYDFEDWLDDDGTSDAPVTIRLRASLCGDSLHCDFSGSSEQRPSSVNAVAAVTRSSVYYVVRCLLDQSVPANEGCFRPISFNLPAGTVVNAMPPAAVSAGNVETSQRIVDALLGALAPALPDRIPAASSGTMNNIAIGGYDNAHGVPFAYYETVGGGAGASPINHGISAVQTHMTNTMNTPVEALEIAYPFRISEYGLRRGSGGKGRHHGGEGIVRSWEFLVPASVTMVSERRRQGPWGLAGGGDGSPGKNWLISAAGRKRLLPSKCQLSLKPGDRLTIETPGGGGWGHPVAHRRTGKDNRTR